MKKLFTVLFTIFIFISAAQAARSINMTGRFVPPDGKTLLFAGQNNADFDEFVAVNKKVPAGFMTYVALSDLKGLDEINNVGTGDMFADELVKKYPGAAVQIGLYLVGSLKNIVNGTLDGNIKEFAKWIKKTKSPVFLRIGYEFDNPENGYEPEIYKKAFIYIIEKMDSLKVENVAYVWHSYAASNPKGLDVWYPGDEYVDWCAISYFAGNDWLPMLKFSQKHSKPLMIAESAPMTWFGLTEAKKPYWYKVLFKFIEERNIKAFSYINCDWNAQGMFAHYNWGNSKISVTAEIEKIWIENIASNRFVWLDDLYKTIQKPLNEK
ncbi:glycosyl hydrolase [Endomicrobium proavitum]|uniref:GH26 domain-containing protein n=1 Tax=Endomicrobium proavitum TaxID=1408281 RepID=A0A0G3WIW7_9BACT|nr:glycosyl hydrolase [Endomicrobium proavitum]AKL98258.1 hypothetical protein Epro_0879 [Endomicrobium proavitum]